jgi:predicted transcriptional regulator
MKKIGGMKVKQLMNRHYTKISIDEPIKKVVKTFKRTNADALPVFSRDRFVGEIFQEDLLKMVVNVEKVPENRILQLGYSMDFGYFAKTAKDIMTQHGLMINENSLVEDAAWEMLQNEIKALMVVNDKKAIVGLITEKDIIRKILKK